MQEITMIDYGASNIRSAQKAFEHLGAKVELTNNPEVILKASKLVLPGVGAFGAGMKAIREQGLDEAIHAAVVQGTPLLGICLGMQFLFTESDEMGIHQGLGLIPGRVTRFPFGLGDEYKVPHMGWNQLTLTHTTHPLFKGIAPGAYCYFVHSYYCTPAAPADTLATTDYGFYFTSITGRENVYGLQFHPEKSHEVGLQLLTNYLEI